MADELVVLVADKNTEYTLRGLFGRPESLDIRTVQVQIYVHPRRDPGCAVQAHEFLRPFARQYQRAMVMFDREGSGREHLPTADLAGQVRELLSRNGWDERAEVIVLDPELEAWAFAPSPNVERCLGWTAPPNLRPWLEQEGLWQAGQPKPAAPKEALEAALRKAARPRSSSIYECLGRRVSLRGCVDPAFQRFRETLGSWFPMHQPA